jgi:hypothetical protein
MICSPDAPAGGMQDLDMESAALEEAIKLYKNLWAASSCKMKACGDDDEWLSWRCGLNREELKSQSI